MTTEVIFIGGDIKLSFNSLVAGKKYIVDGNKVYNHSRSLMVTVTAEEMIKYFMISGGQIKVFVKD